MISKLTAIDEAFAKDVRKYDAIDKEIRKLELDGAPIGDDDMHQLKHDRAMLKDSLYQRFVNA